MGCGPKSPYGFVLSILFMSYCLLGSCCCSLFSSVSLPFIIIILYAQNALQSHPRKNGHIRNCRIPTARWILLKDLPNALMRMVPEPLEADLNWIKRIWVTRDENIKKKNNKSWKKVSLRKISNNSINCHICLIHFHGYVLIQM